MFQHHNKAQKTSTLKLRTLHSKLPLIYKSLDVASPQSSSNSQSEPVTTSSTVIEQIDNQVAPSTPIAEDSQWTTNSVKVPEATSPSTEATIGSEIKNSAAQTPENVSAETKPNVQEPLSAKAEADQKKSVTEIRKP